MCPALVAYTSLSGLRLARDLHCVAQLRCLPDRIVSDNSTEFTSTAILRWRQETSVASHFIAPERPTQNPFVKSFSGRVPDECPNHTLFLKLAEARSTIVSWREAFNRRRSHSAPRQHHACRVRTQI